MFYNFLPCSLVDIDMSYEDILQTLQNSQEKTGAELYNKTLLGLERRDGYKKDIYIYISTQEQIVFTKFQHVSNRFFFSLFILPRMNWQFGDSH